MGNPLDRYLSRSTHLAPWQLEGDIPAKVAGVIVIPVLAEYPGLLDTLNDLAKQPAAYRDKTLVLLVVNNRPKPHSHAADRENNQELLAALRDGAALPRELPLAWIDAASPDRTLPHDEGVGLARKIGFDHALAVVVKKEKNHNTVLVSLDADTRVDANYLTAIYAHFSDVNVKAAVLPYAHPLDSPERLAILPYEIYLRYQRLMLHWAGSPYAFHALGSALACTPQAYAAVGGMPRRSAGEDFYLLQKLAKHGRITRVAGTCVSPSARRSERVPFGTGPKMTALLEDTNTVPTLPHPMGYSMLQAWFEALKNDLNAGHATPGSDVLIEYPLLQAFLEAEDFDSTWQRIRATSANARQCWMQFHRYFDGLKSIRFQHYLRDHDFPAVSYAEGLAVLAMSFHKRPPFPLAPLSANIDETNATAWETALRWLRDLDAATSGDCGLG